MKQIRQKKSVFYHCWSIWRTGVEQIVWEVARVLVVSLVMTCASISDVVADEKDSLRNLLQTRTLHDTARAAVLEHLVILYVDTKPDTALLYARQLYKMTHGGTERSNADKRIMLTTLIALQQIHHERTLLLNEQLAHRLALQRQQIIVGVAISFLLLFAVLLLLLLRARRVVRRRNLQLERATEKVQEQIHIQAAQHREIVKFKRVLDESTDYIVMSDVNTGKILYMNKAYRTLIAVDAPPETLEELMNMVYPHDIAERVLRESIPQAIKHGILTGEATLLDAKGGHVLVLHTTICHKDENSSSVLLSSIMRDVTERKQAEQALEASYREVKNFRMALEAIAIVSITDVSGAILYANEQFIAISQYNTEELLGQNHRILNSGHHDREFFKTMWRTISSGKPWHDEVLNRAKDGSNYWVDTVISPMLDEQGNVYQYISIRYDITTRKQAEEHLRHTNEEILRQKELLEEQSRDIELANSQLGAINEVLLERNNKLLELDREKNEILGIVTHDLKNPIAAVRGLVGLINDGALKEEQIAEIYAQIVAATDRMMVLVDNVLDMNRLESGAIAFHIVEFDMLPLVESVVWQYRVHAEAKNIVLHYSSSSTSNLVLADEQAMMQVLDNLISNAVKYSPHEKKVSIRVSHSSFVARHSSNEIQPYPADQVTESSMTNDQPTKDYVRVEVQDEGAGISPDDMKKLFGKFARLAARPTGGEHSTGLGLSIVKKIVEAMNGRVWCESELGKGATFIVELPRGKM